MTTETKNRKTLADIASDRWRVRHHRHGSAKHPETHVQSR